MLVTRKILAENFRSVEDAVRAIDRIFDNVKDLLNLQKQYQNQVASVTANLVLEINLPSVKQSPAIDTDHAGKIKISSVEKLRKNYSVIQDLWHTRTSLDAMESKIRTSFGPKVDTSKAIAEVAKLRKVVDVGLQDAFAFLRGLAEKHLPEPFEKFNKAMGRVIKKSIAYQKAQVYNYLYEVDGDPTFSSYIQLRGVTDDEGNYFTNLFVVTSYRTGATPSMYISVLQEFVPPSDQLLMRKVKTIKEAVGALNVLLSLDNFATNIGSLPMSMLMGDKKVTRELFQYQQYIKLIEPSEHQMVFILKPEISDKNKADVIMNQIWLDFQGLVRKTNCKPRMAIKMGPDKSFQLTFYFTPVHEGPLADAEDVAFLKEKFNLSDTTMNSVIRTINLGAGG